MIIIDYADLIMLHKHNQLEQGVIYKIKEICMDNNISSCLRDIAVEHNIAIVCGHKATYVTQEKDINDN